MSAELKELNDEYMALVGTEDEIREKLASDPALARGLLIAVGAQFSQTMHHVKNTVPMLPDDDGAIAKAYAALDAAAVDFLIALAPVEHKAAATAILKNHEDPKPWFEAAQAKANGRLN